MIWYYWTNEEGKITKKINCTGHHHEERKKNKKKNKEEEGRERDLHISAKRVLNA
jgi:hypothetical protein